MDCTYNVTRRRVCLTTVAVEKAISIIYSECVFVALGIKRGNRMRRIVKCGLSGYCHIFPHYLINFTIIGGKSY